MGDVGLYGTILQWVLRDTEAVNSIRLAQDVCTSSLDASCEHGNGSLLCFIKDRKFSIT
jgi:hypothetical protein